MERLDILAHTVRRIAQMDTIFGQWLPDSRRHELIRLSLALINERATKPEIAFWLSEVGHRDPAWFSDVISENLHKIDLDQDSIPF